MVYEIIISDTFGFKLYLKIEGSKSIIDEVISPLCFFFGNDNKNIF